MTRRPNPRGFPEWSLPEPTVPTIAEYTPAPAPPTPIRPVQTAVEVTDRDGWRNRAACIGADIDLFFAPRGDDRYADQARAICASCEVKADCLEYALATGQRYGIWGGTTERQRRAMRRARRRAA